MGPCGPHGTPKPYTPEQSKKPAGCSIRVMGRVYGYVGRSRVIGLAPLVATRLSSAVQLTTDSVIK